MGRRFMRFISNHWYFNLRLGLLIFLLLRISGYPQQTDHRQITLRESIRIAVDGSYKLKYARAGLTKAEGQNLEAWSGFLPSLTVSETYLKTTDPVAVFGSKLRQGVFNQSDFAITALTDPSAFENYTTSLQLQVPLLNTDAFFAKAAAGKMVKARRQSLQRTRQAVILEVKSAYLALVLARQNLHAIEDAQKSSGSNRDNARAAYEEGIISRADYLTSELKVLELEEQRLMAYNQMQQASDELKFRLGLSEENRLLSPADSMFSSPAFPDSSLTSVSPGSHPDVQIMHLHQQAANNRILMKRSAWLPRVNGFVNRDWHAAGPFQDDSNDWTAGVQLSWNLFDGLGHWGRKKQVAADASLAEVHYLQTAQKIRNDIDEARRNTTTASKRIAVARLAVVQAREGLNLTKERFEAGLAKMSDLLERETLLTKARLRLLRAQHDYSLSMSELHYKLGKEYQEIQN